MTMQSPRLTLKVSEPSPFGDVTLVPPQISGYSEADLARAMADALTDAEPESPAEALRLLRQMFPDSPLTARVAALGALMRH
jgi:hypothetical protein